ncbi:hypothetical protein [Crocinitomix catalasitica]|uniref:hypothetical protein n=1 Tax=Crocinitomix catalasitica TaxID=184607 RepID=UPI0004844F59|nr:hypothetical protein [Crocinitomix catalasitica]|tara:strand:+ start:198 stop:593 length:396 start_codon:yes stop_codon:yes gene_type:complete
MGPLESSTIILGILYATGAVLLFIASYMLFIKRFKRSKLEAVSDVKLTTSRSNTYSGKTQFLLEVSRPVNVEFNLLDENENKLSEILSGQLVEGEQSVDFDPSSLLDGNYYLSLKTANASILRKIKINKIG